MLLKEELAQIESTFFFHGHGGEVAETGHPGDLANGEGETFRHGRGSGDDDHLVRLGSCTHTLYVAHHC
jgi:hypothetical protein